MKFPLLWLLLVSLNTFSFALLPIIASEHIIDELEVKLEKELANIAGAKVKNIASKF